MGLIAFTPMVWVDELPPSNVARPWWLCQPKPPAEPSPVRPQGEFVPFAEYDSAFKYPLKSSRVPVKLERSNDCIVCSPTLIDQVDPGPDPEPECPFPSPWRVEYSTQHNSYAIFVNDEAITEESLNSFLPEQRLYITDGEAGSGGGTNANMVLEWGYFDPAQVGNFLFQLSDSVGPVVPFNEWACLNGFASYGEGGLESGVGVINCCEEQPVEACVSANFTTCGSYVYELEFGNLPPELQDGELRNYVLYVDWYNEYSAETYYEASTYEWHWGFNDRFEFTGNGREVPCCNPENSTGRIYLVRTSYPTLEFCFEWYLPGCF